MRNSIVPVLLVVLCLGGSVPAVAQTCNNAASCVFYELVATARGTAELTINPVQPGALIVANTVVDTTYGVDFQRPGGAEAFAERMAERNAQDGEIVGFGPAPGSQPRSSRSSHNEWIEMGIVAFEEVESESSSPTGAYIEFFSNVTASDGVDDRAETVTHRIEDTDGEVEISTDYGKFNGSGLVYRIYDGDMLKAETTGQAVGSTATATDWPDEHAYSELIWDSAVTITIPGDATGYTGTELHVYPASHDELVGASKHGWEASKVDASESSFAGDGGLDSLTVVAASTPSLNPDGSFLDSVDVPALSPWGMLLLGLGLAGGLVYLLRRSAAG
ncbi:MAG: IPTL-CTERM sorting domain-containing protein [bacterium]|nr:IPTL-CTERM sorting domain-containing protein [bacterium]